LRQLMTTDKADDAGQNKEPRRRYMRDVQKLISQTNLSYRLKWYLLGFHAHRGNKDCCWPTQEKLAEYFGVHKRRVYQATKELVKRRLLRIVVYGKLHHYFFVDKQGNDLLPAYIENPPIVADIAPTISRPGPIPKEKQPLNSRRYTVHRTVADIPSTDIRNSKKKGKKKEQKVVCADAAHDTAVVISSSSTSLENGNGPSEDSLETELQRRGVSAEVAANLVGNRPQRVRAVLSNSFYNDKPAGYLVKVIQTDTPLHQLQDLGGRERERHDVDAELRAQGYMTAEELNALPAVKQALSEVEAAPPLLGVEPATGEKLNNAG